MQYLPEHKKMSASDWQLLAETTYWLFVSRLGVLTLPFRWLMRSCGKLNTQSSEILPQDKTAIVEKVTWAIESVRWVTPWDSNCLARSLAGKRLLQRRGLTSTLYLGVGKSSPQTLIAHAWLRCGDRYITGAPEHEKFTVVATFA